jgi:hypothetical protein
MTRAIYPFLLTFAVFLASCAGRNELPQRNFEGTIVEVIQMPGLASMMGGENGGEGGGFGGAMLGALSNMNITLHTRGDKVAYNVAILGGMINATSIVDRNARTLTMLLPNHTAIVSDLRSFDSTRRKIDDSLRARPAFFDSLADMIPTPTGRKETFQGVEAEEYHAQKGDMEMTMWLSTSEKVKAFEVMRDALLGRGGHGNGGLDQVFAFLQPVAGKIPVKFETKMKGKTFITGEMKEITEEKLDDAIFEIPKGYKIETADSARAEWKLRRDSMSHDTLPRGITAP